MKDLSGVKKRFFASCCVIVLPPCTIFLAFKFTYVALIIPFKSTPICEKNLLSSVTITAFIKSLGKFKNNELIYVDRMIEESIFALDDIFNKGFEKTMEFTNRKKK